MNVIDNRIQVVIEVVGAKSARIFSEGHKRLLIRGPYYNGILGLPWIDKINCGKIILLAGGMGQAPALLIIKTLLKRDNDITAILAPGKIGNTFLESEIDNLKVKIHKVTSMRREGLPILNKNFSDPNEIKPDLIVSAGPDEQHYGIIAAMQAAGVNLPMAVTNNATMCWRGNMRQL
jgi:NAD(P)H-flavin reductase